MNMQVKGLLDQLEELREQLLAFADDVFHSIDHRNPDQLAQGIEFISVHQGIRCRRGLELRHAKRSHHLSRFVRR